MVHSLFGFENFNGHITSMIHSNRKLVEQLLFSIDVCQTVGSIADALTESEDPLVRSYFGSLSTTFSHCRKNMKLISSHAP